MVNTIFIIALLMPFSARSSDVTTLISHPRELNASIVSSDDPRFESQIPNLKSVGLTLGSSSLNISSYYSLDYSNNDLLVLKSDQRTFSVGGYAWLTEFNRKMLLFTNSSPSGIKSKIQINKYNELVQTQFGDLEPTEYIYDIHGRIICIVINDRIYVFDYDQYGNIEKVTDPLGQVTNLTYDNNGNVLSISGALNIYYAYNEMGEVISKRPPSKPFYNVPRYLFGLVKSFIYPDNNKIDYSYDNDYRLKSISRPNGEGLQFLYNSKNQLTQVSTPEGVYSRTYDAVSGDIDTVSTPNGINLELNYTQGKLYSSKQQVGSLSFEKNISWNSQHLISNSEIKVLNSNLSSVVQHTYNSDSLLSGVGDLSITRALSTGFVNGAVLGNITESITHNSYGEVSGRFASNQQGVLYSEVNTQDKLGRIKTSLIALDGVNAELFEYDYDIQGRLVTAKKNSQAYLSLSYDSNGNVLSKNISGVVSNYTYDQNDRILSDGISSYSHDAFGRLVDITSAAKKTTFNYNSLGALNSVTINNLSTSQTEVVSYENDGLGRRVSRSVGGVKTNQYVYAETFQIEGELSPDGTLLSHYIYGTKTHVPDYIIRGTNKYKLVTNTQGSVVKVVDSNSGATVQQITYDLFGKVLSDTNPGFQPFYFAGGLYDVKTGILRFGARDYNPSLGRWLSEDPLKFEGGSTNFYTYAHNDPINYIDFNGEFAWFLPVLVGAGILFNPLETNTPNAALNRTIGDITLLAGSAAGKTCAALAKMANTSKYGPRIANAINNTPGLNKGGWLNQGEYWRIGLGRHDDKRVFRVAFKLFGKRKIDILKLGPIQKLKKSKLKRSK